MTQKGRKPPTNARIAKLLTNAQKQGYLTTDDLREVHTELDGLQAGEYDHLVSLFKARGVDVLNTETRKTQMPPEDNGLLGIDNFSAEDTVSLYLKEMALTPLLSMDDEVSLAMRIARGVQARREMSRTDGRSREQIQELEIMILDGNLARDALIKANTRLVVSIARRYMGHGVPFLDLIQEGNLGLMKSVEKFEYQRGFRFSTYATWWIRQSITRAIADQGRTIRVPVHMADRLRQIHKTAQEMEQRLGRTPQLEELAAQLELDASKLRWILQVAQQPISLESPVGGEDSGELEMYIEDVSLPSPAQVTYENMLRERVEEVLSTLTPREARILRLRFGLGHDRAYTLEEVGQKFGLTRERIRQIEGKALRRLRQPARARLLRDYS